MFLQSWTKLLVELLLISSQLAILKQSVSRAVMIERLSHYLKIWDFYLQMARPQSDITNTVIPLNRKPCLVLHFVRHMKSYSTLMQNQQDQIAKQFSEHLKA